MSALGFSVEKKLKEKPDMWVPHVSGSASSGPGLLEIGSRNRWIKHGGAHMATNTAPTGRHASET